MERLSIEAPALYGDHHVTAVRAMLFGMPGVEEVYASSAFQEIEITYDENIASRDELLAALGSAGYLGEIGVPQESGRATRLEADEATFYRHSTAHAHLGHVISFTQQVPAAGRTLWPCPGVGLLEPATEELQNG
jgi:hypothetical protein